MSTALTTAEKAAVLHAIAQLDGKATQKKVRRAAEAALGAPEGSFDAKKAAVKEVCEEQMAALAQRPPKRPKLQAVKSFLGKAPRKQLATKAVRVQPPANILDDLDEALRNVEQPGAFASCDHFSDLPSIPLLRVDGLDEPVALPLPAAQARELVSIAQKAAFGRGEDTVVDENVRKAWKIPGARCRFDNAAWAPALSRLVERARQELGVVPRVRAELHDLLVYEAGGHFSPHRDSEKQPGMFGTLVVTLPSAHTGGALEVRHEGETVRFESAYGDGPAPSLSIKQMKQTISEAGLAVADLLEKQDVVARFAQAKERLAEAERRRAGPFDEAAATREAKKLKVVELRAALEAAGADTKGLKAALVERLVATQRAAAAAAALPQAGWCAFYADCEHEIRTVESGYRVALTYNLIHAGSGEAPVPPPQDAAAASLKTLAARWTAGTHDLPPDKVCHFLKHSYTKPALEGGGWHALKGEDAALAEALHGSGAYDVFACTVEQEEHGCAASEEIGDLETTYGVWARPAGAAVPDAVKQLLPKLRFDEAEYTDKNYFCKIKAYQEDGGFDTGNEGAPYSKWYKATALVFWPKARRVRGPVSFRPSVTA